MTRRCTKCRRKHDRKNQRWCHKCHAAYMRLWRTAGRRVKG